MTPPHPDETEAADSRAIGSVTGALIMVAVTVLVAAAMGTFVLDLGDDPAAEAPDATFRYAFSDGGDGFGDANDKIRITYVDGRPLKADSLRVTVDGERVDQVPESWTTEIDTGESIVISDDGTDTNTATVSSIQAGDGVQVIWEGPEGDVVISSVEVPEPDS
ncbi:MAG: type IV pilin, partial [Halobacteriales archaeon]|nr:type IV pilin [Halobacteriales archaeon]